jgi:hypothetical protein
MMRKSDQSNAAHSRQPQAGMGLIAAGRSREQKRPEAPLQERDPECEQSLRREERYRPGPRGHRHRGPHLRPVSRPPTCWQPFAGR